MFFTTSKEHTDQYFETLIFVVEFEDAHSEHGLVFGLHEFGSGTDIVGLGLFEFSGVGSSEVVFFRHGRKGFLSCIQCHAGGLAAFVGSCSLIVCLLYCTVQALTGVVELQP